MGKAAEGTMLTSRGKWPVSNSRWRWFPRIPRSFGESDGQGGTRWAKTGPAETWRPFFAAGRPR